MKAYKDIFKDVLESMDYRLGKEGINFEAEFAVDLYHEHGNGVWVMHHSIHSDYWRLSVLEKMHNYYDPMTRTIERCIAYQYGIFQGKYPCLKGVSLKQNPSVKLLFNYFIRPYDAVREYGAFEEFVVSRSSFTIELVEELDRMKGGPELFNKNTRPPHYKQFYNSETPYLVIEKYIEADSKISQPTFYRLDYLKQRLNNLDIWIIERDDYEMGIRMMRLQELCKSVLTERYFLNHDEEKRQWNIELRKCINQMKNHFISLYPELGKDFDENYGAKFFASKCRKLSEVNTTVITADNIDDPDNVYSDSQWFPLMNLKPNCRLRQVAERLGVKFKPTLGIRIF